MLWSCSKDRTSGTSSSRAARRARPIRRRDPPRPSRSPARGFAGLGECADEFILAGDDAVHRSVLRHDDQAVLGVGAQELAEVGDCELEAGVRRAGIEGKIAHARRERLAETGHQVEGAGRRAPAYLATLNPSSPGPV